MAKEAPVIFVNSLAVHGVLNGVVNLLLDAAQFVPHGDKVDVQYLHAVDLRFDLFCAQTVHDALGKILADNTKQTTKMDS